MSAAAAATLTATSSSTTAAAASSGSRSTARRSSTSPAATASALAADALDAHNAVRVVYEHDYDHTGDGLHQFIDPEDGSEYLYTNLEPYSAHRLFPCFDQPDLKATYALTVDAPAEWELVANSEEAEREQLGDGWLRRRFATTEPFSSYLFALIAGPYHVVRDEHRGVPLGFFCRRSLVEHLDEDELFEVTKQGLDFYADFFDYAYPFGKYDQIFVPEFNAGAMENVGAVTHSERMVFRDPPTENQRLGRAEVLLHEMAHMWFGNLVTMRWWNDLWLNESFATYMAYLSMVEATRFSSAWQAFNSGMKAWAYRQDQLVTTHPIAGQVRDTDETFLNFDGITYGKGASVLKQLVAAVGVDGFREGMRVYFRRHAFGNTTLAEFLDAIGEGAGRDLHGWGRALARDRLAQHPRGQLGGRRWAPRAARDRPDRAGRLPNPAPPPARPRARGRRRRRRDGGDRDAFGQRRRRRERRRGGRRAPQPRALSCRTTTTTRS